MCLLFRSLILFLLLCQGFAPSISLNQKPGTDGESKQGKQEPEPLNIAKPGISSKEDEGHNKTGNDPETQTKQIPCDCEKRYFKHYEAKNCTPIYDQRDACKCPEKFQCLAANEEQQSLQVCSFRGKTYQLGQEIVVTDPCRKCTCQQGYTPEDGAVLGCVSVDCPELLSPPLKPGCYHIYDKESCCSVRTACDFENNQQSQRATCKHNDKTYELGQRIYPDDDNCLTCICTTEWSGLNSASCRKVDCLLEEHLPQLRRGCLPIYHANNCCPIDYHCPSGGNTTLENAVESETGNESNLCYFDRKYYARGEVLDINHPTNCVTCSCDTPPELTCIHQACPPIPNNDYENCEPTYRPGVCCPEYTCRTTHENIKEEKDENDSDEVVLIGPPPEEDPCSSVICAEKEQCVMFHVLCATDYCPPLPTCIKVNPGCPTPNCEPGCVVRNIDKNHCPSCTCGSISDPTKIESEHCPDPVCNGYDCVLLDDADGCKSCHCEICEIPKCQDGCELQEGKHEGQCSSCRCHVQEIKNTHVAYLKEEESTESGKANDSQSLSNCSQPLCLEENCKLVAGNDGCNTCSCEPSCPSVQCDTPGCSLETDVSSGRCPQCRCSVEKIEVEENKPNVVDVDNTNKCPEPVCAGYNCEIIPRDNGCKMCKCEYPCSHVECNHPLCEVESNPPPGNCPGCVCKIGNPEPGDTNNAPEEEENSE
ncbi:kielin/chordin-like protein isoform X2 [Limulus polyphemus]|uniref:Kielin/chordin-like protein isoform X2 n=1 Tax=Limulus polyphemus TaxID=6850 RepID=A0ABM1C5Q4_LIMPO|nr:kielin/chordin-like protein isoform X2 [Limulus polyphemus]